VANVTVNRFIMIQMIIISNKCCSFELSIHQRILKKMHHSFHKNWAAQPFNIDNNKKLQQISILETFLKDHVRLKTGVNYNFIIS